jgi:hypothetical protein
LKWQSVVRCQSALHLPPYDPVAIRQSQKVTAGTYFLSITPMARWHNEV